MRNTNGRSRPETRFSPNASETVKRGRLWNSILPSGKGGRPRTGTSAATPQTFALNPSQKMETIAQRIERLQSSLATRQSPPVPRAAPSTLRPLEGFQDYQDPILQEMHREATSFLSGIINRDPPRWLTFWGRNSLGNGTGKTLLCKLLIRRARAVIPAIHIRNSAGEITESYDPTVWIHWPTAVEAMQAREDRRGMLNEAMGCGLLVLDDIGAENATGPMLAKLGDLLNHRLGKWTLITSNLSPDDWQERDARISSRIIRDLNRQVCCETIDFALRP